MQHIIASEFVTTVSNSERYCVLRTLHQQMALHKEPYLGQIDSESSRQVQ